MTNELTIKRHEVEQTILRSGGTFLSYISDATADAIEALIAERDALRKQRDHERAPCLRLATERDALRAEPPADTVTLTVSREMAENIGRNNAAHFPMSLAAAARAALAAEDGAS